MKVKVLLSSFSLKLKEKWVAFMRPDEVLNNNNISKPHRLKSYGFHLPLLGHQGGVVLVLAGFLLVLSISLFNTTPTSASQISLSFSAATGSCGNDNGSLCLNTPANGGIVTGGHTITAQTDTNYGFTVTMQGNSTGSTGNIDDETNNLSNAMLKVRSDGMVDINPRTPNISSITSKLSSPSILDTTTPQWGVALIGKTGFKTATYYTSSSQNTLK